MSELPVPVHLSWLSSVSIIMILTQQELVLEFLLVL